MIVVVLDHCQDDTDGVFIVNTDKLDLADPEQKQYHDAIFASIKWEAMTVEEQDRNHELHKQTSTGTNIAFTYMSDEWAHARVMPHRGHCRDLGGNGKGSR